MEDWLVTLFSLGFVILCVVGVSILLGIGFASVALGMMFGPDEEGKKK